MPNQNCVILAGHLARDPELRYVKSGTALTQFCIGTNREYEKEGQKKSVATFVDCKAWASVAELVAQLKKGDGITITGEITTETWDDKTTGQKRSKTLVQAASAAPFNRSVAPATQPPTQTTQTGPVESDDPPF